MTWSDFRERAANAVWGISKYFSRGWWDGKIRNIIISSPAYRNECTRFNRKLREVEAANSKTVGRLEAATKKELTQRVEAQRINATLQEQVGGLEATVGELSAGLEAAETRRGAAETRLKRRAEVMRRQAAVTESLYSRLVMSERFATGHESPLLFVDRDFRIIGASAGFTKEFGYEPDDLRVSLPHVAGSPLGDVDYDTAGKHASALLANPTNLDKLRVLNEAFYPRSRETWHYDICLTVKPKGQKNGGILSMLRRNDPNNPVSYMANVTVAIDRGEFIGASIEFRKMGRAEVRRVGLSYIMNRDALVTADACVTEGLAEEYRKKLTALYTHDMVCRKRKTTDEFEASVTVDFVNTETIETDALAVFREMYDFTQKFSTKAGDERIKISFIHLNEGLQQKLVAEGIPVGYLHLKPKEARPMPTYEVQPGAELLPEGA